MATEALQKLHQMLIDTRAGYAKAAEEAERPDLKRTFSDMVATRDSAHHEVHQLLTAKGEAPDDEGSVMAVVHKTVIGARAAITGIDDNALSAFVSGEDHVLGAYDAALSEQAGDAQATDLLARQKAELLDKLSKMKALAEEKA